MEHVILFAGPMGAGKTTAIQTLSDVPVVSTEAANTERDRVDKPTTTVALDYGEMLVSADEKVRLYGIPGQRRFDFMWRMLAERAQGMVLLVGADAPDPVGECLAYLDDFADLVERGGVVIGITRADVAPGPAMQQYAIEIARAHPGLVVPVLPIDARDAGNMRMLLMTLIANLDAFAIVRSARVMT